MTTPEQPPRRPEPPRPVPPRPEFAVTPLRAAPTDATPKAVAVSLSAWVGSFVVLAGIAGAIALDLGAVRDALEASVAADNPGDSATDITDTVNLTLIGSGAIAVVLILLGLLGIQLLRARKPAGRITLAVVGVLSAAGGVGLWTLLSDAGDATAGVLQWAPLAYSALVAVGVLALFAPGVSPWLRRSR
ncbi:hypothetical protein CJ179_09765 [Rhodococcus sp. ACS1]|uniref:Tryptophan-associated transmembrane protein (Trp_oprn_chp) n=1 Tax=Rhodococcus koreensis TaxID=99653 RepID=A0A1H4QYH4_9NOCA|nr:MULTISPECIES: hypothetical protein [Rhodococcus]PBC51048.1 hypothetical protein CJ179_09765 [Rhodococcus sp. ACS1]QSE83105.1 hypothetical protein JWS14_30125 [Rhodococcus koreensis]SEC24690.1 hypothetical protein SAMN04490239_3404 [Rhodococcus koreensis]